MSLHMAINFRTCNCNFIIYGVLHYWLFAAVIDNSAAASLDWLSCKEDAKSAIFWEIQMFETFEVYYGFQ